MEGAVRNYGYPGYPYISLLVGKPRSYELSWKLNQKDPKGGFCGSILTATQATHLFQNHEALIGFPTRNAAGPEGIPD
jgi:hypothetical protein